jgi:hypothetical protein
MTNIESVVDKAEVPEIFNMEDAPDKYKEELLVILQENFEGCPDPLQYYRGHFETVTDYAREVVDERTNDIEWLSFYIDYDLLERDLLVGDIDVYDARDGGFHIFFQA